jgi:N,N'-diacetyllegionaminate synthase
MILKSKKNPIFFIAEVGSNHEGDFSEAKKIINDCLKSKTDSIKIQIYNPENIVSKKYEKEKFKHFSRLQLNVDQYIHLAKMCKKSSKLFSASIWDKNLIKIFDKYIDFYKIGSGDLTNYEILDKIISKEKPILLSSGLASFKEVRETINFIIKNNKKYKNKDMISLLHCNTAYPTPLQDTNLGNIKKMKNYFERTIGFSDHTIGDFSTIMSVIYGAKIIEKHYSINKEKKSFRDHQISFNRQDLDRFIYKIQSLRKLKYTRFEGLTKSEKYQNNLYNFRRSIYLKRDMKKKQVIKKEDIQCLRPFIGICSSKYFKILGKKIKKNLKAESVLKKGDIIF